MSIGLAEMANGRWQMADGESLRCGRAPQLQVANGRWQMRVDGECLGCTKCTTELTDGCRFLISAGMVGGERPSRVLDELPIETPAGVSASEGPGMVGGESPSRAFIGSLDETPGPVSDHTEEFNPGSAPGSASPALSHVANTVEELQQINVPPSSPEVLTDGHHAATLRTATMPLTPALSPSDGARVLNAWQVREAKKRVSLVEGYVALKERHPELSMKKIADRLGVNNVTLGRYVKLCETAHRDGSPYPTETAHRDGSPYLPKEQWIDKLAPAVSTGRPVKFKLTAEMHALAHRAALESESKTFAVRLVAEHPDCPPEFAEYLRTTDAVAPSLLRAVHVTEEEYSLHRGEKDFLTHGWVNLREMKVRLKDGTIVDLEPGDLWELDDASSNHPFWFEDPHSPNGIGLGRQGLYCVDVRSSKWLGVELIGRRHDAYKAEDILRFLRKLMQTWRKPRIGLRLERGIWRSKVIKGFRLSGESFEEVEWEQRGWEESEKAMLQDGLKALGIEIFWAYKPNTKAFIEGGLSPLWKTMRLLPATDIGRYRGEFERGTKAMLAAQAGRCHPAARGFAYIDELSWMIEGCMGYQNEEFKRGRLVNGKPNELWAAAMRRLPMEALKPIDLAVFLPATRERQIRGGHVWPEVDGKVYQFSAPEWFGYVSR